MSLNGLDNATVKEAHETASAEPGGWFLLKYASRDEVEVYAQGTSGIVGMRNAIAKYEEASPLYGFLRYRRRNVIIKCQPDECSRLVQARATVHFSAVCERFTPYNTTFEITGAKELKDTKLSAACSLHAASGSQSSSTSSLRRRRLMEITEEEDEEERERKRQSIVHEERPNTSGGLETEETVAAPLSPVSPVALDRDRKDANFASTTESPNFEGVPRPSSPAKSDFHVRDSRRFSTQTARPELYSYSTYTYGKPKVKLGPRPSLDTSKRPHTASNFRPVAALPAGFKLASKSSKKGPYQEKTDDGEQPEPEQAIPEAPILEPRQDSEVALLPPRPATSSGTSIKSTFPMAPIKENKISPEKVRLMKAMKLREQKKKMSIMSSVDDETVSTTEHVTLVMSSVDDETVSTTEHMSLEARAESRTSMSNADSAIAVDLPMTANTETNIEDTFTESHPPSPILGSSEVGESTQASSLSESTDETVLQVKPDEDADKGQAANNEALPQTKDVPETRDDASPIAMPGKDVTHYEISAREDATVAKESGDILEQMKELAAPTRHDTSIESIEVRDAPQDLSDIQAQEVVLPPGDDNLAPKSPYGIPVSKFSSNETKSPTTPSLKSRFSTQDLKVTSEAVPALPSLFPPAIAAVTPEFPPVLEDDRSEAPSPDPFTAVPTSSSRLKVAISPIRTDLAKDTSGSDITDPLLDDELMDELQAATVQEAHPMMVSKSPITPVFPSTSPKRPYTMSGGKTPPSRAFSNPMRGPLLSPGDISSSSARSVSAGGAAFLHNITRQTSNAGLSAKKNTGNSIAQRIKALQQLSGKSSNEELRPRTAAPATSFVSVRKSSVKDTSKSPSFADRANPLSGRTPTPERSRDGSPDAPGGLAPRGRSGSVASRLSMFETGGSYPPRGRPESIQVTARIVRDANPSFPMKSADQDPTDYNTAELKQSPLVIDHLKAEPRQYDTSILDPIRLPAIEAARETIQERRLSRDRKSMSEDEGGKKRRSSLSIVKDFIKDRRASITSKSTDNLALSPAPASSKSTSRPPSVHQTTGNSIVHRLSISSRRSFSRERDSNPTPVMSPAAFTDPGSGDEDRSSLSDKKSKGRTSRFMRRLSNSLGGSRKNMAPNISPTVREEDDEVPVAQSIANASHPSLATYIGDVNVQFPDNLLWKRRSLCLDSQGFLILSPVQGAAGSGMEKSGLKRYHLSDFRQPYVPDVDLQELPNSICLDFIDGSGLQVACEGRTGQRNILNALQDAHQNHTAFGQ